MYLGKASKVAKIVDPRTYNLWTDRTINFTVRQGLFSGYWTAVYRVLHLYWGTGVRVYFQGTGPQCTGLYTCFYTW